MSEQINPAVGGSYIRDVDGTIRPDDQAPVQLTAPTPEPVEDAPTADTSTHTDQE